MATETHPNSKVSADAHNLASHHGITKREYFAVTIMSGLLAAEPDFHIGDAAAQAVRAADMLINVLNTHR